MTVYCMGIVQLSHIQTITIYTQIKSMVVLLIDGVLDDYVKYIVTVVPCYIKQTRIMSDVLWHKNGEYNLCFIILLLG